MAKRTVIKALALFLLAMVALGPLQVMAAEVVDIQGVVEYDNLLVDDEGQVYEIADTPQGNALADNYIGQKVTVKGTLEIDDDDQVLVVTSFQTLSE